jgi:polysaccharide deacetylase family protein (PEP-CTERM system associated)
MLNAMTVDVEDYFHTEAMTEAVDRSDWSSMPSRVQASTEILLELFARKKVTATLFFLGWVAEKFPSLVLQAVQQGHEVACHSYWHRAIFRLSPEEFREDTIRARDAIEAAGNVRILGYRAPSFSLTPGTEWAVEILAQLGFQYDSSVNPVPHDFYDNAKAPRAPHTLVNGALLEIPIATVRLGSRNLPVGGGAYFRILPYRYSAWGVSQINKTEGRPAMFYLHPWEIDAHQPRLKVKLKSRIRQYTSLASTYQKLELLLGAFQFGTVAEVFSAEISNINHPGATEAHSYV